MKITQNKLKKLNQKQLQKVISKLKDEYENEKWKLNKALKIKLMPRISEFMLSVKQSLKDYDNANNFYKARYGKYYHKK